MQKETATKNFQKLLKSVDIEFIYTVEFRPFGQAVAMF